MLEAEENEARRRVEEGSLSTFSDALGRPSSLNLRRRAILARSVCR